jgi:hypothetical protein
MACGTRLPRCCSRRACPCTSSRRLGHKNIQITLDIYAHVLPSMQQDAAQRLFGLLYKEGREVCDQFVINSPTEAAK